MKGDRVAVGCAASAWLGVASGWVGAPFVGLAAAAVLIAVGMVGRRWLAVVGVVAAAGVLSGFVAADRTEATLLAEIPEGRMTLRARVIDDQRRTDRTVIVVVPVALLEPEAHEWSGPPLAVDLETADVPAAGSHITVSGRLRSAPGRVRGDPVAGRISEPEVTNVVPPTSPLLRVGNALRRRVRSVLGSTPADALVAGFLIGDTSGVPERDLEALRRSGLTHFVAVSGSNVALFLGLVWLLTGPFLRGIRSRAVVGLAALAVFVVATRWEPSVLRAATVAALLLVTASLGIPVRPWVAFGSAVVALLLWSGQLGADVGFQLSVAATAGVLIGVRRVGDRRPRFVFQTLGAAVGAQVAVAPILLLHFGAIPAISPLANLVAGPLVALTTLVAVVAVGIDWGLLSSMARLGARAVVVVATVAADWPQLGWVGAGAVGVIAATAAVRPLRPIAAAVAVALLAIPAFDWHRPPDAPTLTVLDVGQGDSSLIEDSSGVIVVVDGGRDPGVLSDALRARRIRRIDLLVVTHGDLDHVGGLDGIGELVAIGRLWYPSHPELGETLEGLVEDLSRSGAIVEEALVGTRFELGDASLEVVGPRRRYLAQNDGSVVLWLEAGKTVLLAGDVEAVAQRELPALRPDVLLVPHHGAATTDLGWLSRTIGSVAVVSVGENTYGHPAPEVMAVLATTELHLTQDEGDVVITLR